MNRKGKLVGKVSDVTLGAWGSVQPALETGQSIVVVLLALPGVQVWTREISTCRHLFLWPWFLFWCLQQPGWDIYGCLLVPRSPRLCWKRMWSSRLFYREEPLGAASSFAPGVWERGTCSPWAGPAGIISTILRGWQQQKSPEAVTAQSCSFSLGRFSYFGTGQRTASVELAHMYVGRVHPLAGLGCSWKATLHLSALHSRASLRGSWACFFQRLKRKMAPTVAL